MPTMNVVKIDGAKLRKLREERFLTQAELAGEVGLSPDHIGRLEREAVEGSHLPTIRKLAAVLGVGPAELVKDGDDG